MSINTCTISGNLGKDPEYKVTRSGTKILNMFLAVNERVKDGTEWKDYTNWIGVTLFGKRAESLSKFLRKGMKVCVSGRLHYSAWESDNGNRRSKVEVIADEVDVMQKPQHDQQQASQQPYQEQHNGYDDLYSEDCPF